MQTSVGNTRQARDGDPVPGQRGPPGQARRSIAMVETPATARGPRAAPLLGRDTEGTRHSVPAPSPRAAPRSLPPQGNRCLGVQGGRGWQELCVPRRGLATWARPRDPSTCRRDFGRLETRELLKSQPRKHCFIDIETLPPGQQVQVALCPRLSAFEVEPFQEREGEAPGARAPGL